MSIWGQEIARLFHTLYYDLPARYLGGFVLPSRNVTLELTYRCNLTCDFCYLRVEEERGGHKIVKKDELTFDEIRALLQKLPGRSNVTFVGGEVTIKDRFWELVELTTRRHRVSIGTNAVLFTPQICNRIVAAGVRSVGTSVDGPEDIHDAIRGLGTFRKTTSNIRKILDARREARSKFPQVNMNCVIVPENISCLAEVLDVAQKVGVDACSFQVLDPSMSRSGINLRDDLVTFEPWPQQQSPVDIQALDTSLREIERRRQTCSFPVTFVPLTRREEILDFYQGRFDYQQYQCSLPWTTLRVSPTGDVFPCLNYRIGNVRAQSLGRLWNHQRYRLFRRQLKQQGLFQSCAGCCKMLPRHAQG